MTNDRKQGQAIPNKETQEGQGKNKEHKTVLTRDISPPSRKVHPRTAETSKGEGRVGTLEAAQEEAQTETREATKEGGAREERWPPTPGGRPTAAEQVVEEPEVETESQ